MSTQAGVFVLQGDRSIVPMQPAQFAAEGQFQELIARFPMLLVGDQVDPADPRRWVLVKREQSIGLDDASSGRWSIDHVFLDQDGIPTLVEVKRQTDTRIRREVVGQMLDYAANCATFWTPGTLRSSFEQTCTEAGRPSEDVLAELLGAEGDAVSFWPQVDRNLTDGRIRLLFVADVIPIELRRIVEFLNRQMDPAEVLAIELRQFEGQGLRTIVPTVLGRISSERPKGQGAPKSAWDESGLLRQVMERVGPREAKIAQAILLSMRACSGRIDFGKHPENASVATVFRVRGKNITPARLYGNGKLEVYIGEMKNWPILNTDEDRMRFIERFTRIIGTQIDEAASDKFPKISLSMIAADPDGENKICSAFGWFDAIVQAAI